MSITHLLPVWQPLRDKIDGHFDVIYTCPKYCLGEEILNSLVNEYRKVQGTRCILLRPRLKPTTQEIDYGELWHSIEEQLKLKAKRNPKDGGEFRANFLQALSRRSGNTILFFRTFGRGKEQQTYDFLYFISVVCETQRARGPGLNYVCLDDFSFWFFERYSGKLQSEIRGLARILYSAASEDELREIVRAYFRDDLSAAQVQSLVPIIKNLSGGHVGLLNEMCARVKQRDLLAEPERLQDALKMTIMRSEIFEGLRRDIEEDPVGLAKTALEFVEPSVVVEYASPRYQFLRQLGILQWYSPAELILCPGMIHEFIEGLAKGHQEIRLGTVETNYGMREFVEQELEINDDDFVLVHLSDLHVGKDHGYRVFMERRAQDESKEAMTDLIERDLKRMELLGRVDALVISGDLVCTGDHDEFRRVKVVIDRIMEILSLDNDRVLIIPGNHDLNWKPGVFATAISPERSVSMEGFLNLLDLLRKEKFVRCDMTSVISRSKRYKLRLIGLDSNDVEGPDAGGIGYVSRDTLAAAEKLLDSDPTDGFAGVSTWLVVHHHVLPVTSATRADARVKRVSVMSNAQDLIAAAANWGVEAILHGHEHQPAVTWTQRWAGQKFKGAPSGICVIGAGSCGVSRDHLGPVSKNQYNVLIKRKGDILIRSRIVGDEGVDYLAHNDIVIAKSRPDRN